MNKEKLQSRSDVELENGRISFINLWEKRNEDYQVVMSRHRDTLHTFISALLTEKGFTSELVIDVRKDQTRIGSINPDAKRTHECTINHRCNYNSKHDRSDIVGGIGINWFGSTIDNCSEEVHSVDYLLMVGVLAVELRKEANLVQLFVNAAQELTKYGRLESRACWELGDIISEQNCRKGKLEKERILK